MATNDILPFASPHGQVSLPRALPIAASTSYSTAETSYNKGEVCVLTAGFVGAANAVTADGAVVHSPAIHFIAAAGSEGELSRRLVASATVTHRVMGSFIPVLGEQEFITANLYNNSDVAVVPIATDVGNICGWWRDNTAATNAPNGHFGVDQNGTGLIITRVLDANGVDIKVSGGTGVYVVFKANGE